MTLGTSTVEIGRVGLGTWAMGGGDWVSAWGTQDDRESIDTIRSAVDSGIDWIDTAAVYGLGHAEEVLAEALRIYPEDDRPVVATKGGMVWDPANRRASSRRVADAATLRGHVEDSLRRLDVDVIDIYFVHWPATVEPVEEYWATMLELKEAGKVSAIGLSNHDLTSLQTAHALGAVDVIQPQFSAVVPEAAQEVLPWAQANGVGVVGYSSMGSGLLTGAFTAERVAALAEDDWRRRSPLFTHDLEKNLRIADAMAEVGRARGTTAAAVAVAWTLGFPGLTSAIVGARRPDQLRDWIDARTLTLTEDEYLTVAAAGAPTP
ncbi:aldo/keto reductase [Occultella gossypii]|uniref:Aldo/keto reductase n=1 Tax=Occultella gossypii TaxID=2800820 RepID=A0ABS7SC76_9MICO|nr:aldo/keto reductase [Occultella gossypii]MBZ2197969.1 aldo/keto reductase [Occultella gossypii]